MAIDHSADFSREAVGIFHSSQGLEGAVHELLSSGFHRSDLSLLASERAVEEKLGHRFSRVDVLADDPEVPRAAFVSTEAIGDAEGGIIGALVYVGALATVGAIVASGGTLLAMITGAALAGGASGLVGSMLAQRLGDHHAHYLQEQIVRGGLLLWVRTREPAAEERAIGILRKHSADKVHVHGMSLTALDA
ncbi:hypothetical protein AI27_00110 [Sphingomonas sp. BHC-A]|uniref:DUF1269 domain-containing protein n=1 Tax=Sphingobium indicum (strain DSM 16412 / CCM 7286 / MTCC 6364 / B90A) TaxID=861109 RepID=A0A1L5BKG1_SPHIB|nr:hypothetical protein [Sphingobium indicum]APL93339.1 hypothetical protein SIDU_01705 [Sphingobium indicum B90A]KEZ00551.1 hypothetical protein AI27_00110 [Sphingomonas sp. BHC-A]